MARKGSQAHDDERVPVFITKPYTEQRKGKRGNREVVRGSEEVREDGREKEKTKVQEEIN
jgi:hypothetical protein